MKKIISFILILASIVLVGCKKEIKPESIVIGYSDNSVVVGEELHLTVSSPTNNASLKVKWSVDNSTIGTVNQSGVFKGLNEGTVEVTATSTSDSEIKDSVVITVINQVTKEYREPINQLLKFTKDENIIDKFGTWVRAEFDGASATFEREIFLGSLESWVTDTTPFIRTSLLTGGENQKTWLYELVDDLFSDIYYGISFEYSIGSIDEYKDHYHEGEDTLIEEGYNDIKVIEVHKIVNAYNPHYTGRYDKYYFFAVGKKDNKLNILDYSLDSYFYNGLDFINDYYKDFTSISEIPVEELPSSFDYCLDPDFSRWGYRFDFDSKKAYKVYTLINGTETTGYFLGALRIGTSGLSYFDEVESSYSVKYLTILSALIRSTGYDSPSYYKTALGSPYFSQESLDYAKERFGFDEIIEFTFPNYPSMTYYYGITKKGDEYRTEMVDAVILNDLDFLNYTLELHRYYSSFSYSLIEEKDYSIDAIGYFDYNEESLNLKEIIGYKVTYKNQFITEVRSVYFFKDVNGRYHSYL